MGPNLIFKNVIICLIDCLDVSISIECKGANENKEQLQGFVTMARRVLPALLLRLDMTAFEDNDRIDLGIGMARPFFEQGFLDTLWPVQALKQVQATWGADNRYFDAVLELVKNSGVTHYFESRQQKFPWATNMQQTSEANQLERSCKPNDCKEMASRQVILDVRRDTRHVSLVHHLVSTKT